MLKQSIYASQPGFHPKQLDDGSTKTLRAWFDPRDSSKFSYTSGRISSYINKVTGVAATEVSSNGPALGLGLNGGACLICNGSEFLRTSEAALINVATGSSGHEPSTVIWLFQPTNSTFGAVWGWGDPTEAFNHQYFSGARVITRNDGSAQTQWSGANAFSTNVPVSCSQVYLGSGSTPTLRRDGVDQSMSVSAGTEPRGAGACTHFTVAARSRATTDPLIGLMGPMLIYQGALSTEEQDLACNALRSWYGLSRF